MIANVNISPTFRSVLQTSVPLHMKGRIHHVRRLLMKRVHVCLFFFAVLVIIAIFGSSVAQADPTVSVSYNPQPVQFSHDGTVGGTRGSRTVNVAISRRDSGTFCDRVGSIYVYVDMPESRYPADRNRLFSKKVGTGGLCNFDETVPAELITQSWADQACAGDRGKTKTLDRTVKVELKYNNGNSQTVDERIMQAQVKCDCLKAGLSTYGYSDITVYTGRTNQRTISMAYGQGSLSKQITGTVPQGMTLDMDQNGYIKLNGQPSTEGDYTFTVGITDSCIYGSQKAQQAFTVPVRCDTLAFPSGMQLPPASIGIPYSYQLRTTCSSAYTPQQFSAWPLPTGLTVSPTGLISGTPTTAGTYNVSIESRSNMVRLPTPAQVRLPLQVRDGTPPSVISFTVAPFFMAFQGGQATAIIKTADNTGVSAVNVILIAPGGSQSNTPAKIASGNAANGEWRATLTIPANNGSKSLTYIVKAVLSDASNNSVTSQNAGIKVQGKLEKVTTTPAVQAPAVQQQPALRQQKVPPISPQNIPETQAPKTPGPIR